MPGTQLVLLGFVGILIGVLPAQSSGSGETVAGEAKLQALPRDYRLVEWKPTNGVAAVTPIETCCSVEGNGIRRLDPFGPGV